LRRLWAAAEAAFRRAEVDEVAWGRARSALALFTPEGRLNSRPCAEAVVQAAMAELVGTAWAKTRRLLSCPESFTFLDQAARRLADLDLGEEILSALLDLEGLRRQPWRLQGATPAAATARGLALARVVSGRRPPPSGGSGRRRYTGSCVVCGGPAAWPSASTAWRGCSSRGTAR
jgi:hypothetical protein